MRFPALALVLLSMEFAQLQIQTGGKEFKQVGLQNLIQKFAIMLQRKMADHLTRFIPDVLTKIGDQIGLLVLHLGGKCLL